MKNIYSSYYGGGFYLENPAIGLEILSTTITNSFAYYGGTIYLTTLRYLKIDSSTITNTDSTESGTFIYYNSPFTAYFNISTTTIMCETTYDYFTITKTL